MDGAGRCGASALALRFDAMSTTINDQRSTMFGSASKIDQHISDQRPTRGATTTGSASKIDPRMLEPHSAYMRMHAINISIEAIATEQNHQRCQAYKCNFPLATHTRSRQMIGDVSVYGSGDAIRLSSICEKRRSSKPVVLLPPRRIDTPVHGK